MRGDSVVAKAVNGCTGKTLESLERLRQEKKHERENKSVKSHWAACSHFQLAVFFMIVMHSDNQQGPMNETSVRLNKQQQI